MKLRIANSMGWLLIVTAIVAWSSSPASAQTVVMNIGQDASFVNNYPGPDGLVGNGDDVVSDALTNGGGPIVTALNITSGTEPFPGYGTITIVFNNCNEAVLTYNFPSVGLSGQMTLTRVVPDNVALCQALDNP